MYVGKTQARSEFIRDFLGDRRSSASNKLQFDGEALFKYFFQAFSQLGAGRNRYDHLSFFFAFETT